MGEAISVAYIMVRKKGKGGEEEAKGRRGRDEEEKEQGGQGRREREKILSERATTPHEQPVQNSVFPPVGQAGSHMLRPGWLSMLVWSVCFRSAEAVT